jgi:hypothetical protein
MENKVRVPALQNRVKVWKTESRRGVWICPDNGQRDHNVETYLQPFIRRLIWNRPRLCWVLPLHEGLQFYHKFIDSSASEPKVVSENFPIDRSLLSIEARDVKQGEQKYLIAPPEINTIAQLEQQLKRMEERMIEMEKKIVRSHDLTNDLQLKLRNLGQSFS